VISSGFLGTTDPGDTTQKTGGLEIRSPPVLPFKPAIFIVSAPYKCLLQTTAVQERVVSNVLLNDKTPSPYSVAEPGDETQHPRVLAATCDCNYLHVSKMY
jgi:hypothetical protein